MQSASGGCCAAFGAPPHTHDEEHHHHHGSWAHDVDPRTKWQQLQSQAQAQLNPCNSPLHPAVVEGVIQPQGEELCVQEAYTPQSVCFGCGPANHEGLHLQSKRILNGLEATITLPAKYCAFPGVVNGGIVGVVVDCHSNWTAAIALMDRSFLPRPPFTLTASMYMMYKEPTPPSPAKLLLRSQVVGIKDNHRTGKARIEVETHVYLYESEPSNHVLPPQSSTCSEGAPPAPPGFKLLAVGQGVHKRLGALRAL